ncbi:class I SAM-dependent methyltransferase [Pedobacter deserti]|uniref:class I SAM-dependent methyltransferase n=1 Tax=Pedobacter deserti TaxID=2817382 RepID=UPI002109E85F|nr:class I SAM-dependent methyltransferase [Pedobacter sp. SYSU D00382]
MQKDYSKKSTTDEIRARFDADVERFSDLEGGQATMLDAALTMDLCTEAALCTNPEARELLDIGCGAGNYTLKMLSKVPGLNCTLNDLSMPMLHRARERVAAQTTGKVTCIQDDMRNLDMPNDHYDIVLASATFHHLRDDADWENVFKKVHRALKPGGSLWISDIITHDTPALADLFEKRFANYLESLGGAEYRDKVIAYVDYEDTPRSLNYQLELMRRVGFRHVEILHKNSYVAAFGGIK